VSRDSTTVGRDELITSAANPTIKLARSLHRKRVRYRERAILVEGMRTIQSALDLGMRPRTVLIDASRVSDVDGSLLSRLRDSSARTLLVDSTLFEQVTDTEHPQPLVAICDMPTLKLPVDSSFVIALDGVRDPGNLGTLVRSAAAAGADGVALLRGSVDPYNPKVVRATVGTVFAIPVQTFTSLDDIVQCCFLKRPIVVISDSAGGLSYDEIDWNRPALVVIGGEAGGVSEHPRTYADVVARIPMAPGVESLNAAVAGSIIAFEVARQRRSFR
jgi:TrmH family RNA methyltransferase